MIVHKVRELTFADWLCMYSILLQCVQVMMGVVFNFPFWGMTTFVPHALPTLTDTPLVNILCNIFITCSKNIHNIKYSEFAWHVIY